MRMIMATEAAEVTEAAELTEAGRAGQEAALLSRLFLLRLIRDPGPDAAHSAGR